MYKKSIYLVLIGFLWTSSVVFSQDSIPIVSNVNEQKLLKFQQHFFKALAQKAIENYQIAIESLELCNEIQPNEVSVLFELSKNYFHLHQYIEAIAYAKQAVQLDKENNWILEHLVKVYRITRNFDEAIKIQEQLVKKSPKWNEQLVYLYVQNGNVQKAKELLQKMESNQTLNSNLRRFKKRFSNHSHIKKSVKIKKTLDGLISDFETNKNFETLRKIFALTSVNDNKLLLKYSTMGVALFPAQAIVYLMYAKALNKEQRFSKALEQLQNGIDFVIDNKELEARFYEELAASYDGLGNEKEAIKNKKKALELRKKIKK